MRPPVPVSQNQTLHLPTKDVKDLQGNVVPLRELKLDPSRRIEWVWMTLKESVLVDCCHPIGHNRRSLVVQVLDLRNRQGIVVQMDLIEQAPEVIALIVRKNLS